MHLLPYHIFRTNIPKQSWITNNPPQFSFHILIILSIKFSSQNLCKYMYESSCSLQRTSSRYSPLYIQIVTVSSVLAIFPTSIQQNINTTHRVFSIHHISPSISEYNGSDSIFSTHNFPHNLHTFIYIYTEKIYSYVYIYYIQFISLLFFHLNFHIFPQNSSYNLVTLFGSQLAN